MDDKLHVLRMPPDVENALDELLESWARQVCLTPSPIPAEMSEGIVVSSDLGYDWWKRLADQVSYNQMNKFSYGWNRNYFSA